MICFKCSRKSLILKTFKWWSIFFRCSDWYCGLNPCVEYLIILVVYGVVWLYLFILFWFEIFVILFISIFVLEISLNFNDCHNVICDMINFLTSIEEWNFDLCWRVKVFILLVFLEIGDWIFNGLWGEYFLLEVWFSVEFDLMLYFQWFDWIFGWDSGNF